MFDSGVNILIIVLADAIQLQKDTMSMLTETQQLTGVTVNADALIQKADEVKLGSNDLRSRVSKLI